MKTGLQEICNYSKALDSGLRRNDENRTKGTFYESILFGISVIKRASSSFSELSFVLTGGRSKLKIELREGGEVHEMDVSPCNSLLDLRFVASVLSRTLNGSSDSKKAV